ncbi:MAG: histidinol-phosphate transaminase [Candidatus Poribacteria bacterium]|nr:histidinol-phosphate transaminase [Candidatus Poribacteria bacterium]
MTIRQFLRPDLSDLNPYHVEQPPHRFKLDANESPFDLPTELREDIANEMKNIQFQRYPDPSSDALRTELSEYLGVDKGQIVVGNGSDELIGYLVLAFGRTDACVSFPTPTFAMYHILARIAGLKAVGFPLDDQFNLNEDSWQSHLDANRLNLAFISNPNNPTSNTFSAEVIRKTLSRSDALVVLDEAYCEFSGKTFFGELNRYPNLVIARTFSKAYGLAGLRIGYLIAHPEIINEINKVRLPYNLNRFSQLAALLLLKQHVRQAQKSEFSLRIQAILKERERVYAALQALDGVYPFPTDANFILFRTESHADKWFQHILDCGILVRNLSRPGPLLNCLRVTIGTPAANSKFLEAMASY